MAPDQLEMGKKFDFSSSEPWKANDISKIRELAHPHLYLETFTPAMSGEQTGEHPVGMGRTIQKVLQWIKQETRNLVQVFNGSSVERGELIREIFENEIVSKVGRSQEEFK